ncbi:DegT/DnrJ/EryC1/StrS family aminotransferase [Aliarcobacter butzleri]
MKIMPLSEIEYQKKSVHFFLEKFKSNNNTKLYDLINTDRYFYTNSGKEAIRIIVEYLNLQKEDEVFITTTTESSYVSTCVSATLFNYSKISRVLTDKTKVVYVIHNFSFPHPKLLELRKLCDDKGLILIEDCAFAFDSYIEDIRLGSIGDFTIYSLPKIFPVSRGGILSFKKDLNFKYFLKNNKFENFIEKWIPKIEDIKIYRRENYNYLKNNLNQRTIYGEVNNVNPFMYGFYSENYQKIYSNIINGFELGLTHVKNEVHIPVNAFICKSEYKKIIERLTFD